VISNEQGDGRMNSYSALKGKTVIVTGGARGLGEAISRSLARNGSVVYIADVREEQAAQAAAMIRQQGGDATAIRLDVTDPKSVEEAVLSVLSVSGRMDALINNAGIDRTVAIEEMSREDWSRILSVNLTGPFLMAKRVLPIMREQGGGHIVNIVSTAAKRAWPNASAYHASKWGLLGFSHALHTEARPHNIKVTALLAGGMRTPFLFERFPDIDINTLQDPRDVAETVCYLLSVPQGTVIPELMALPMRETSWP
jgi:NAD(P)-dependent dehydrogenase (short-subunit alcohol dehydrogenase family)